MITIKNVGTAESDSAQRNFDQARKRWLLTLIRHYYSKRASQRAYSHVQWDSALKATRHSPKGDVSYVRAYSQLRAQVPTASGLAVLAHC